MGITSADALRNRREAQRRIVHHCSCGRAIHGNPGWASHLRANPEHHAISRTRWRELSDG